MESLIPIFGMLTGIIVPVSAFAWQYIEGKEKRETILEIAKHVDDPARLDDLLAMLDERKQEPVDYRRGGVITLFVGIGIYLLGAVSFGNFFSGIGLLVGAIGIGVLIAGYLYPNTSDEINIAVERFEKG
ncbi:MAG: DUF6249 domain-containing protein [Luminiphilus sp.]|nr:DUF6249 domain-containing protein [Luminiphilus sp.]